MIRQIVKRWFLRQGCRLGKHPLASLYWTDAVAGRRVQKCAICDEILKEHKVTLAEAKQRR